MSDFGFLKRKTIIVPTILLVALLTSYGIFKYSQAQLGGSLPFGGLVTSTFFCTCSANFMVTVSGPVGGTFMYTPGTQAYESYNLGEDTGMWVLGLYSPGGGCYIDAPGTCDVIPTTGVISPTVGTSPTF